MKVQVNLIAGAVILGSEATEKNAAVAIVLIHRGCLEALTERMIISHNFLHVLKKNKGPTHPGQSGAGEPTVLLVTVARVCIVDGGLQKLPGAVGRTSYRTSSTPRHCRPLGLVVLGLKSRCIEVLPQAILRNL